VSTPRLVIAVGVCVMLGLAVIALWFDQSATSPTSNTSQVQASAGVIYTASFPDASGIPQSLGRWQQNLLVINFWATWCGPCKAEMPVLSKLQQKYAAHGLQIVGIAADSTLNVGNFAQKTVVTYPLLSDEVHAMDFSRRLGNRMNLLPYTVVVRPGGEVVHTRLGAISEVEFEPIIIKNLPK